MFIDLHTHYMPEALATATAKATVANARLSETERQAIISGNAERLLRPYL